MKVRILAILAMAGVLFAATDSQAFLSVSVSSNPFVTPGYDINATTSGVVEYYIVNNSSSTSILDQFYLSFESDVFASFSTSTPGFSVSGVQIVATGLNLNPGESITLTVNYTLFGPASTLDWDEGSPWEQGWVAIGKDPSYFTGGSTNLTPEPNTLLLLGAGLFGLGARARRRKKHRQKAS
ncbi:MAG: PEP-CTERM sorting domain-containing protein [candidate division KSB1 bacterium]|nr:PEP-CTERM sorting domain-containing protein [candidate division KSB1 bacterium]MDQ7062738.1 PEP-CTERM sorting domain-containing protein [candidate division KSB1 bacterium]